VGFALINEEMATGTDGRTNGLVPFESYRVLFGDVMSPVTFKHP